MRRSILSGLRRRRARRRAGDAFTLPVRLNIEAELVHAPEDLPLDELYPWWELDELPWWRTDYGQWRLTAEVAAMRRFPGFTASVAEDERLTWKGRLESGLAGGRDYLVRVTYPWDFPDDAPEVSFVAPVFPDGVPHLLSGQRPCLYRDPHDGYEPASTTAATLVAWTALWIHAFETWRATGEWPGREA